MVDKTEMKVVGRAWGLLEPVGFGKYFPDGDYVGWEEKVKECPHLKGKEYIFSYVASKFSKAKEPLKECEIPEVYKTEKGYKELASMILLADRLVAVDEDLKNLIEKFEPGIRQFFPLRIEMPRSKVYPKAYYGLIILNWRNSFVPELSAEYRESVHPDGEVYYFGGHRKKGVSKLVFSSGKIGNIHLWREERLLTPDLFMSDALVSAIEAAGLSIFRHYPVKLV